MPPVVAPAARSPAPRPGGGATTQRAGSEEHRHAESGTPAGPANSRIPLVA